MINVDRAPGVKLVTDPVPAPPKVDWDAELAKLMPKPKSDRPYPYE